MQIKGHLTIKMAKLKLFWHTQIMFLYAQLKKSWLDGTSFQKSDFKGEKKKYAMEELAFLSLCLWNVNVLPALLRYFFPVFESFVSAFQKLHIWQEFGRLSDRLRFWAMPALGKESVWNAGDPSSIPESGRSPGEGNGYPLQYFFLIVYGQRSLVGYSPCSRKELDTTEQLTTWQLSENLS